jgi:cardiolipin synthase
MFVALLSRSWPASTAAASSVLSSVIGAILGSGGSIAIPQVIWRGPRSSRAASAASSPSRRTNLLRSPMTLHRLFLALLTAATLAGCVSGGKMLRHPVEPASEVRAPAFRQAIGVLLGPELTGGNRVKTLENGDEIFPAMLDGIRSARQSITFETYVFEKGTIAGAFAEALAERARAGVKVHAVIDAHGGNKGSTYFRMMREAGVELEVYHPIFWWDLRRYNNRTHRKLLVIDGKTGFIGGVGIADQWQGNGDTPEEFRDYHYRVEGPAVAHLQAAFMDNWLKTRGALLAGPAYFPALPRVGSAAAAAFYSSPRHGSIDVVLMYHLAIASARKSLLIENAYFVPDAETVDALIRAAQRGVRVELIVPGRHIDQKAVRRASRKRWGRLLEGGVHLYEYQPTMLHSKLLIADGLFVSIGSANFDNRSLRLNDEANLNVLDAEFAAEQTRLFDRDRANSKKVTLENFRKKSLTETPVQVLQTPLEPQL